jgi:hypothetical protein
MLDRSSEDCIVPLRYLFGLRRDVGSAISSPSQDIGYYLASLKCVFVIQTSCGREARFDGVAAIVEDKRRPRQVILRRSPDFGHDSRSKGCAWTGSGEMKLRRCLPWCRMMLCVVPVMLFPRATCDAS